MRKKQRQIKSIRELIEQKTKRLNYVRTPYLRDFIQQNIDELKQIEWMIYDLQKENQDLKRLLCN